MRRYWRLIRRVDEAVELVERALIGTERRRAIWTDADYLAATLALLTDDHKRAREALDVAKRRAFLLEQRERES